MQRSDNNHTATTAHRKVQASTTLNRKYVKKPVRKINDFTVQVKRSPKVSHFNTKMAEAKPAPKEEPIAPAVQHPMQATAISRMQQRNTAPEVSKMTAKELKDQAIKKALSSASKVANDQTPEKEKVKKAHKMRFGFGRVVLALSCAAAAVFAIVYFVNLNMPDISMRVAAMQTGIEASYPSYVPRDFSLSDIMSENGKIVLSFKNSSTNEAFTLTEESSSWDSNALLTNFVRKEYGEDYSIVREQGLTIYVNDKGAAWVNGGMMFKINVTEGTLTKKQIRSIATSL